MLSQICATVKKEYKFLSKDLPTIGEKPKIDTNKIVVLGHELGGLTAISSSIDNKKVKFAAAIDPWMFPYSTNVRSGKMKFTNQRQNCLLITTERFTAQRNGLFDDVDLQTQHTALEKLKENSGKDLVN